MASSLSAEGRTVPANKYHTHNRRTIFRDGFITVTGGRVNPVVNEFLQQQQQTLRRSHRSFDAYREMVNCHVDEHGYAFLTQGKNLYIWQQESASLHSAGTVLLRGVKKLEVPVSASGEPCFVKFNVRKVNNRSVSRSDARRDRPRYRQENVVDDEADSDDAMVIGGDGSDEENDSDENMSNISGFAQERNYHVWTVGLFAISREGHYRYWPDVIQNGGSYRTAYLALDGADGDLASEGHKEQSFRVAGISNNLSNPSGQIYLWTTNDHLYQVNTDNTLAAPVISLLKRPAGVFSAFRSFFSTKNTQRKTTASAKHKIRDVVESNGGNELHILTEVGVEHWSRNDDQCQWEFLYDWDLLSSFKNKLAAESDNDDEQNVWILALDYSQGNASTSMHLLAASCPAVHSTSETPLVTYHVWGLSTRPTREIAHLFVLPYQHDFVPHMETQLYRWSSIYAARADNDSSTTPTLFIIAKDQVIILTDQNGEEYLHSRCSIPDTVGSGLIFGRLLSLVSFEYGSVLVSHASEEQYQQTVQSRATAISDSMTSKELLDDTEIEKDRLLQHFAEFKKTEHVPLDTILRSSKIATMASRTIVDSRPSSDWISNITLSQQKTSQDDTPVSLLVLQQLESKRTNHEKFLQFLGAPVDTTEPLWNSITDESRHDILEHGEKIAIAIALRKNQNLPQRNEAFDARISRDDIKRVHKLLVNSMVICCKNRNLPHAQWSPENFFQQVTRVNEFLDVLVDQESNTLLEAQDSPLGKAYIILTVNAIFEVIMEGVIEFRKRCEAYYKTMSSISNWTTTRRFLIGLLDNRLNRTKDVMEVTAGTYIQRVLVMQIYALADFQLSSFDNLLSSFPEQSEMDAQQKSNKANTIKDRNTARRDTVKFLRTYHRADLALDLANKYHDFDQIILISDTPKERHKLIEFARKYRTENFPYHLLKYFESMGMYDRLLQELWPEFAEEIGNFVCQTPELMWMHQVQMDQFSYATETLKVLAMERENDLSTSKTRFSLLKLASLVASEGQRSISNETKLADNHLKYIDAQEMLFKIEASSSGSLAEMRKMDPEELFKRCCDATLHFESDREPLDLLICASEVYTAMYEEEREQHNTQLLIQLWRSAWNASFELHEADLNVMMDNERKDIVCGSCLYNLAVATEGKPTQLTAKLKEYLMETENVAESEKAKLESVFHAYRLK